MFHAQKVKGVKRERERLWKKQHNFTHHRMFVYVYCFASVINMYITEPTNRQPEKIERPQLSSPERARASQCHKNCMHAKGMRGKKEEEDVLSVLNFSFPFCAHVGKVSRKVSYEPWRVAKAAWALHKRQKAELIRTNDHLRYIGEEKTMWIETSRQMS